MDELSEVEKQEELKRQMLLELRQPDAAVATDVLVKRKRLQVVGKHRETDLGRIKAKRKTKVAKRQRKVNSRK